MHEAYDVFTYISTHQWEFDVSNTLELITNMNSTDRIEFCCDVRPLVWKDYLCHMYFGMRRHLLNEKDSTVAYAKRRYKW